MILPDECGHGAAAACPSAPTGNLAIKAANQADHERPNVIGLTQSNRFRLL
jgi:hypothetical protein